jgi:hypothetical protein
MANVVLDKAYSVSALAITLASLGSSTAGVGRQGDIIDNSSARHRRIKVYVKIKLGTSPANNTAIYVYAIRGDQHGTAYRDDAAGASDAGLTVQNAPLIGVIRGKSSAASGDVLTGSFIIDEPGPEWTVAIVHDTNVALDATGSNHFVHWIPIDPEIQ